MGTEVPHENCEGRFHAGVEGLTVVCACVWVCVYVHACVCVCVYACVCMCGV